MQKSPASATMLGVSTWARYKVATASLKGAASLSLAAAASFQATASSFLAAASYQTIASSFLATRASSGVGGRTEERLGYNWVQAAARPWPAS